MKRAVVIGGGIGGLTAAIALKQKGWEVQVLERAPAFEDVGSGLAIAANALKALDLLGLGDDVRTLSMSEGTAGIRAPGGAWLTRTTNDKAKARYGDSFVILVRPTLMSLLAGRAGEVSFRTEVTGVDAGRGVVSTSSGDLEADLIVGADGIHSAARKALFPDHPGPVYSGVTAWRALVPRPDRPVQSTETWGRGLVVGIHQLADDVYFYATDLSPAGAVHADERAELTRRFSGWHDPIPSLMERVDNARILRNDVYHLATPLPAMHRAKVALVGDAAHAMTPNLGQGANQAIEDGVVLAHVAGGDLAAYTAARQERTAAVVRRSYAVCRMTKLRNPLAVRLRDLGMSLGSRLSPDLMLRSMDEVLGWTPPGWAASDRARAAQG